MRGKFCNKCGKELPSEGLFCPECGARIIDNITEGEPDYTTKDFEETADPMSEGSNEVPEVVSDEVSDEVNEETQELMMTEQENNVPDLHQQNEEQEITDQILPIDQNRQNYQPQQYIQYQQPQPVQPRADYPIRVRNNSGHVGLIVLVAVLFLVLYVLVEHVWIWKCDECGKSFFGHAYYGWYADETLCSDCAHQYWRPMDYKDYTK